MNYADPESFAFKRDASILPPVEAKKLRETKQERYAKFERKCVENTLLPKQKKQPEWKIKAMK